MVGPRTLPTIYIVDSFTVFTTILLYFLPTYNTPRHRIRHEYTSISYYHSGLLHTLLDNHHKKYTPPIRPHNKFTSDLYQYHESVLQDVANAYTTTPIDILTFDPQHLIDKIHTTTPPQTLDPDSPPPSQNWMKHIKIFTANHQCFIHLNSHQLTSTGTYKKNSHIHSPIMPSAMQTYGLIPSPAKSLSHLRAAATQPPPFQWTQSPIHPFSTSNTPSCTMAVF
jgi:hypothetical protein